MLHITTLDQQTKYCIYPILSQCCILYRNQLFDLDRNQNANQMTGFCLKFTTGLKWVNVFKINNKDTRMTFDNGGNCI